MAAFAPIAADSDEVLYLKAEIQRLSTENASLRSQLASAQEEIRILKGGKPAPPPEPPKPAPVPARYVAPPGAEVHKKLLIACMNGNEAQARQCISEGADLDISDELGVTPLHWAASGGHASIVQLLVQTGADVNKKNRAGKTPLQVATGKAKEKKLFKPSKLF